MIDTYCYHLIYYTTPCFTGVSEGSLGSPEPPQNLSVSPPRSTSPEPQDLSLPSTSRSYQQHQYHHRDYHHYPSHTFHPPSASQSDNANRGEENLTTSHENFPVENLERDIKEEYPAGDEEISGRENHLARFTTTDFRGEISSFGRENLAPFTDSGGETSSFGRETSGGFSDFDRETTTTKHTDFEGENSNFGGGENSAHLEPSEEEEREDEKPPGQQQQQQQQCVREQVDQDQYQEWARRYILAKQGQVCVCVFFGLSCMFFYLHNMLVCLNCASVQLFA